VDAVRSRIGAAMVVALLFVGCGAGSSASTSASAEAPSGDANARVPSTPQAGEPTASRTAGGPSPTPGIVGYGSATLIRGWEACSGGGEGGTESTPGPDGITRIRGMPFSCRVVFNDARASGSKTGPVSLDGWGDPSDGAIVEWAQRTITNDEGTWVGQLTGIYTTETGDLMTAWYRGTGAYEGLSMFIWMPAPPGSISSGYPLIGPIFEGEPPPPFGQR
jgi:hypothetical protein